jgi:hypothetical protein
VEELRLREAEAIQIHRNEVRAEESPGAVLEEIEVELRG